MSAIAAFLHEIASEAGRRGYKFDIRKIARPRSAQQIRETRGQLEYEWGHLRRKLKMRSPAMARRWRDVHTPQANPLFRIIAGEVRAWEKRPARPTLRRPACGFAAVKVDAASGRAAPSVRPAASGVPPKSETSSP
jgi:hypothetical protein